MSDAYLDHMLGDKEEIILVSRQHWIVLAQAIILEIILVIAIIGAVFLGSFLLKNPLFFIGLAILIIPFISLLGAILKWANHKYVVTNRRLIQIFGVFNKNVTDSSLDKVNDVKMDQTFFGRIFGYGDIEILTASELGVNRFTMIGNPVQFKTAMLNAKMRLESGVEDRQPAQPKQPDIPTMIAQLAALREKGVVTEEEFQKKKAELLSRL
ncbi:MAG: PH domain-containing protein [Anaerolineaceae bacterium]|jgi:uncharacterized membrane protein YdbT with pleckstrin-like domain